MVLKAGLVWLDWQMRWQYGVLHGTETSRPAWIATWGTPCWVRLSTLALIVARVVVRVPRACITSFRAELLSGLDSSSSEWN